LASTAIVRQPVSAANGKTTNKWRNNREFGVSRSFFKLPGTSPLVGRDATCHFIGFHTGISVFTRGYRFSPRDTARRAEETSGFASRPTHKRLHLAPKIDMNQTDLLERCRDLASRNRLPDDSAANWGPEDAIGFFQTLRPDGDALNELFDGVDQGDELRERLLHVFRAAGDSARPDGARDAYFVVRKPMGISAEVVEHAGRLWLKQLAMIDNKVGDGSIAEIVDAEPQVRVLEGDAPKHPRATDERSDLLNRITSFSDRVIEPLEVDFDAVLGLRRAYYFIACDTILRDYLMWPAYRNTVGLEDPLEPYFTLWRAGVKFRIFNNEMVDFYMPRRL
jgi:hypothetical protein